MIIYSGGWARRFIGRIGALLADHWRSMFMCLLLINLVLAPYLVWIAYDVGFDLKAGYLLFVIGLCLLAIASRPAFALVLLLLVPPALLHQHVSRHWGGGQLDARIEAYYESPAGETREYLESHIDAIDVVFLIGALCYLVFLLRWVIGGGKASPWMRWLAASALVAGLIVFAVFGFDRHIRRFPPYATIIQAVVAKDRSQQLLMRNHYLEQHPLADGTCRSRYDKVVIVLGESAISDHLGVLGYEKPTTPFAVKSGPHAFDALSPSNQTRYALGMMLTRAAPGAFDSFFRSHSLVGELRKCGFYTVWISNQGRRGEHDSFSTSIAKEADEQVFLNDGSWKDAQHDGEIVQELDSRRDYLKNGQATFIHLIGSHTRYDKRFPAGFGFPGATDVVSQYDNSILYTDHVLSELHARFSGGSLLLIYVSDHGQIVSESKFGSGFMPGYKEEFRTPLLIWTDDDAAVKTIRDDIGDSRLNLESFDDVVRFLVGMSPTPRVSTRQSVSVLKPDYVEDYAELESIPGN